MGRSQFTTYTCISSAGDRWSGRLDRPTVVGFECRLFVTIAPLWRGDKEDNLLVETVCMEVCSYSLEHFEKMSLCELG